MVPHHGSFESGRSSGVSCYSRRGRTTEHRPCRPGTNVAQRRVRTVRRCVISGLFAVAVCAFGCAPWATTSEAEYVALIHLSHSQFWLRPTPPPAIESAVFVHLLSHSPRVRQARAVNSRYRVIGRVSDALERGQHSYFKSVGFLSCSFVLSSIADVQCEPLLSVCRRCVYDLPSIYSIHLSMIFPDAGHSPSFHGNGNPSLMSKVLVTLHTGNHSV